jgi:hypothetical protein
MMVSFKQRGMEFMDERIISQKIYSKMYVTLIKQYFYLNENDNNQKQLHV